MGVRESDAAEAVPAEALAVGAQEQSTVGAFFAGVDVLVTGASGFIGRALIEKLLRDSPDIGTIFLLLRPKRGVPAQERIAQFTNVVLFDRLRAEQPGALGKLRAVEGDAALPQLGIREEERAMLEERVAVVFHAAASVRFDDPLKKAVLLNVRGTRDLCEMALRMPRLKAFVHVSTAYSTSDNRIDIEEKLYPPPGDWRIYIKAAETLESRAMDALTRKLLGGYVNTYIFTKGMAEHVINDYRHGLPVGIIRPSIVNCSEEEPIPGWLDNFNGASSLLVAGSIGATHLYLLDRRMRFDVVPVDHVVRGTVLQAVYLGINRKSDELHVVNATGTNRYLFDMEKVVAGVYTFSSENRVQRIYKCFPFLIKSIMIYRILFFIIDLPISLTLDGIAWCFNQPRRMLKIHRRAIVATMKISYFTLRTFNFTNNKYLALTDILKPKERKNYNLSNENIILEPYLYSGITILKDYFFRNHNVHPGRQDAVIESIHFAVCGLLLLIVWKSGIITQFIWIVFNTVRFVLAF